MEKQETSGGLTVIHVPVTHPLVHSTYTEVIAVGSGVQSALAKFERIKRGDLVVIKDTSPAEFGNKRYDVTLAEKEPGIHRVEFIIWKGYWVCNIELDGVWHSASFPNHASMIEFLAEGQTNKAKEWPVGRRYTNE